jgi:translation initiation factor 2B subunit (eIF-2B alpha/beta/delta family)
MSRKVTAQQERMVSGKQQSGTVRNGAKPVEKQSWKSLAEKEHFPETEVRALKVRIAADTMRQKEDIARATEENARLQKELNKVEDELRKVKRWKASLVNRIEQLEELDASNALLMKETERHRVIANEASRRLKEIETDIGATAITPISAEDQNTMLSLLDFASPDLHYAIEEAVQTQKEKYIRVVDPRDGSLLLEYLTPSVWFKSR